jgi:hypothetical protein
MTLKLANGRTFLTQEAALAYFRAMLARYLDDDEIVDKGDYGDLLALLQRYDQCQHGNPRKIGVGVDRFFRRRNYFNGYSSPGFWIRRVDGSETDFSYIKAVRARPRNLDLEFQTACRMAVDLDLLRAKRDFFERHGDLFGHVPCELTGRLIAFEEANIDHADPTFRVLVATFRATRGWQDEFPVEILTPPADGRIKASFADASVAEAFRQYHHAAALLRVIAADVNSAMGASQRRPTVVRPVLLPD